MEPKFRRRRKYFIKMKFQREFILKFCILVTVGAIISGGIVYILSMSTVTTTFENSRLVMKSTADFILPAILLSSAIVIVFIGFAMVIVTLFTSHRVAGPLYRMEKDIKEVASGNLTKTFRVRQNDELKTLATSLDEMTKDLRAEINSIKRVLTELESTVTSERAKVKLDKMKRILDKFET